MRRTLFSLLCAFGMMGLCLWIAVSSLCAEGRTAPCYQPDRVESYTVGSLDRLQIRKIYLLSPEDTPDRISTDDFQEYGCSFRLSELTKEPIGGSVVYTAVFIETGPSS